ncbi:MAG: hypothetical protein Q9227_000611 [Pyrenula ochraceoflavens]
MADQDDTPRRKRRRLNPADTGPYVLKPVLENIPLEIEGGSSDVRITSVEYWNNNLYIGTSASEILHYVCLPPDSEDDVAEPTYILASRLQPSIHPTSPPPPESKGVQQILLLPGPGKACILCDGLVTFYSLPELSPAYEPNKIPNCRWIGGIDANQDLNAAGGQVMTAALANKIMLVRVGDDLRRVGKNMEFPDCRKSVRRDTIACVADSHSYALLEVEHQQKIPLFHISSLDETEQSPIGKIEDLPARTSPLPSRSSSLAHRASSPGNQQGHERSTSLGNFVTNMTSGQNTPRPVSQDLTGLKTSDFTTGSRSPAAARSPERRNSPAASPTRGSQAEPQKQKPLPPPPPQPPQPKPQVLLKPHIVSPTPTEFLLTTGTKNNEAGVGMFVNVDGDVVRGTLNFAAYPESLVLDDPYQETNNSMESSQSLSEGYVIAAMTRSINDKAVKGLEIQRWDASPEESTTIKGWLDIPGAVDSQTVVGLRTTLSASEHSFSEVGNILQLVRLRRPGESPRSSDTVSETADPRTKTSVERVEKEKDLFEGQDTPTPREGLPPDWESKRNKDEAVFARRFGNYQSQTILWASNCIWRSVRNPLALQLEASLESAETDTEGLDIKVVLSVLGSVHNREARTESEFLSLNYIRQKASLLLFQNTLSQARNHMDVDDAHLRATETALIDGGLDPRVILLLIPLLQEEVLQSAQGLWVNRGVAFVAEEAMSTLEETSADLPISFYMMIRRYLTAWQGKEGFGSITEVDLVSESVDAALLHLLLHVDSRLPAGSSAVTSVRTKLHNVVDTWKGAFPRAVTLLEEYKRLFVLSRLYQSRKLAKDVLATWKRVCNGEVDAAGELNPPAAESRIRHYLPKRDDAALVEEYSIWLANRNPSLAISALTDSSSRVKLSPSYLIPLLKSQAPAAVQPYLEHLVFTQSLHKYADDLVGYYLDSVLSVLETDESARQSLSQSYSTYRALDTPKPTYVSFITENAPDSPWWQARLRLLQLLGGGSYAAGKNQDLQYSIDTVLQRLAPYSSYLVSESIILDARQGRHEEALRLLVHGLGDYDTAVRYCYFGGPAAAAASSTGGGASGTVDADSLPSFPTQKSLFSHLLREFLAIEEDKDEPDVSVSISDNTRLERTTHLLSTFSRYFDEEDVLTKIPESWAVGAMAGFWEKVLRRMEGERIESGIVKGLVATLNLRAQGEWVEGCEKRGGWVERDGTAFGHDGDDGDGVGGGMGVGDEMVVS